jgi:hypothetical protein
MSVIYHLQLGLTAGVTTPGIYLADGAHHNQQLQKGVFQATCGSVVDTIAVTQLCWLHTYSSNLSGMQFKHISD